MRLIFAILGFLFFVNSNIELIRNSYVDAASSKEQAEAFYKLVQKEKETTTVIKAYKGAARALKARYTSDKKQRKDLFVQGVTAIEELIKHEPNNVEIRLIRLSIQENTPKILRYKSNIEQDKQIIIQNYKNQTESLKYFIRLYVNQSKVFTDSQKKQMVN